MQTTRIEILNLVLPAFRMMGIKGLSVCIFLFVSLFSTAQDFEEDLKKVGESYASGNYSIVVDYVFYGGFESEEVLERQSTVIKKQGTNFHTNQFGTEIITDDNYVLIIDHSNSVLVIDNKHKEQTVKQNEKAKKEINQLYQQLYKTMGIDPEKAKMSESDIVSSYLGKKNGNKGYRLTYAYGDYEFIEFYIDPKTNRMSEVWMYFRTPMEISEGVFRKPKVKLIYGKQGINPSFSKSEFEISNYVKIASNGDVVVLKEKYKSFELINHLKKLKY